MFMPQESRAGDGLGDEDTHTDSYSTVNNLMVRHNNGKNFRHFKHSTGRAYLTLQVSRSLQESQGFMQLLEMLHYREAAITALFRINIY